VSQLNRNTAIGYGSCDGTTSELPIRYCDYSKDRGIIEVVLIRLLTPCDCAVYHMLAGVASLAYWRFFIYKKTSIFCYYKQVRLLDVLDFISCYIIGAVLRNIVYKTYILFNHAVADKQNKDGTLSETWIRLFKNWKECGLNSLKHSCTCLAYAGSKFNYHITVLYNPSQPVVFLWMCTVLHIPTLNF